MRLVILVVLTAAVLAGCGGSGQKDISDALSTKLNAYCERSDYQIINRLDSSKTTIYNCSMPSGKVRCVTESDGIDRDVTSEAKILFSSTLGSGKPACIS